ncbi:hypothetical protein [Priestia megaterium]
MNVFGVIKKRFKQVVKFIDKVMTLIFEQYGIHTAIISGVGIIFWVSFKLEIANN